MSVAKLLILSHLLPFDCFISACILLGHVKYQVFETLHILFTRSTWCYIYMYYMIVCVIVACHINVCGQCLQEIWALVLVRWVSALPHMERYYSTVTWQNKVQLCCTLYYAHTVLIVAVSRLCIPTMLWLSVKNLRNYWLRDSYPTVPQTVNTHTSKTSSNEQTLPVITLLRSLNKRPFLLHVS